MTLDQRITNTRELYAGAMSAVPHKQSKLDFLYGHGDVLEFLVRTGFTPYHVRRLMSTSDYDKVLRWLTDNYADSLQKLGFTTENIAKIFSDSAWETKAKYLQDGYERELKPLGFEPSHMADILYGIKGIMKLNWIRENYQSVSDTISPAEISWMVMVRDWKALVETLLQGVELLRGDDEPIGIRQQLYHGEETEESPEPALVLDDGPQIAKTYVRVSLWDAISGELLGYKAHQMDWFGHMNPEKFRAFRSSSAGIDSVMMARLLGELNANGENRRFRVDVEGLDNFKYADGLFDVSAVEPKGPQASYALERQGRRYVVRKLAINAPDLQNV
ncbi:MAG: hypothetical protein EPN86_03790 [Nanoarchaeota archaeon]|nr:MAG: hypothetical protein EPN86_03790 [Nanoarchaeota archaeon]